MNMFLDSPCISDEELLEAAKNNSQSIYHPVGTCKMGDDENSVVDEQLKSSWDFWLKSCGCIDYA